MKHQKHSLKSVEIAKHITLLSDANVLVRFRAQQQAKSSLQHTANCIAVKMCLRYYRKIHYLTREFRVKLHAKTHIALITLRFVRYGFSRAI